MYTRLCPSRGMGLFGMFVWYEHLCRSLHLILEKTVFFFLYTRKHKLSYWYISKKFKSVVGNLAKSLVFLLFVKLFLITFLVFYRVSMFAHRETLVSSAASVTSAGLHSKILSGPCMFRLILLAGILVAFHHQSSRILV